MEKQQLDKRRPIKSRSSFWAKAILSILLRTGISPNQVSVLSIIFAAMATVAFLRIGYGGGWGWLLIALAGIQLRLLCNLLDGMLAVEGGRASKTGEMYNELPDRVSDLMIIVGAGVGFRAQALVGMDALNLAWCAALLAVGTAYVRVFGASLGAGHIFNGPMAKPQRMALISAACIVQIVLQIMGSELPFFAWVLALMIVGTSLTIIRRTYAIRAFLQRRQ